MSTGTSVPPSTPSTVASVTATGRSTRIGRPQLPHLGRSASRPRSRRFSVPQNGHATVARFLTSVTDTSLTPPSTIYLREKPQGGPPVSLPLVRFDSAAGSVADVVRVRRVHPGLIAHALGDLVVRACRVAADSQPADDAATRIQRHPTPERDDAARDFALAAALPAGRRQKFRVKEVGLVQAPQRMPRLGEGVEHGRREGEYIEAERVGGVRFRLGDRLAPRPYLRGVRHRCCEGAELTVTVHDSRPHERSVKQPPGVTAV